MLSNEICVAITNYDFSENADGLKEQFSAYFPTILIDSSSPVPPRGTDLHIENTYYPGLWNAAVNYAIQQKFKWLMFVASDLQIPDIKTLCHHALEASEIEAIGVYSPSVARGSRLAYPQCYNRASAVIRESGLVEGFFFLARVALLQEGWPSLRENRYGWGIDLTTCFTAYRRNYHVVVDDRVEIYHPPQSHAIDVADAMHLFHKHIPLEIREWRHAKTDEIGKNFLTFTRSTSLDLGCGRTPRNPLNASRVHGIDLFEDSSLQVKKADLVLEKIPFPDQSMHYVTAFDFLGHIPRLLYLPQRRYPLVELMDEIFRVLKPGGIFLSVAPAFPAPQALENPAQVNFITEGTFSHFCSESPPAKDYGFRGAFKLLFQRQENDRLISCLRVVKPF
jgi:SAM-dependent methyltransferase